MLTAVAVHVYCVIDNWFTVGFTLVWYPTQGHFRARNGLGEQSQLSWAYSKIGVKINQWVKIYNSQFFYRCLGVRTFFDRVWRRMFERCYIVTRMCASPRNLTWFIRRFSSWEDIVSGDVISLHYHSQWTNSITAMIDVHLYTVCVFIYYFTHTWINFLYVWLNIDTWLNGRLL